MIRNRRIPLRFILAGTTFAALLFTVPLLTQESFDPSSVQPTGCQGQGGKYDCGMKPPSAERMASIPLAPSAQIRHRGLPSRADLSGNMPPIGNQGQQGSCVAWATGYALKSYHERVERNWSYDSPITGGPGNRVFSPAYIYNQINGGRDDGSVIADALALMVRNGAAPWSAMPYNPNDYRTQPTSSAHQAASKYRAQSYKRLEAHNVDSIKAELSKGNPVVFGIGVDDAFYQVKSEVYDRNSGQFYGGHAMTLVGYDDSKRSPNGHTGAFKMINSWGTSWGDRGYAWISYRHWVASQPWALVMYDRTDSNDDPSPDEPEQLEDLDDEQLQPPAQVSASQGSYKDKVVINWAPVNGAVVYVVARAEPTNRDNFEYVGYAQETKYEDTAVQPDVAYRYIIVAAADRETYSDPQRSPIAEGYAKSQQQITRPGQVTGIEARVKAVAGRGAVSINWTETSGATSYQVVRYDERSNKWAVISRSTRGNSFSDSKPVANQTNYYSVRAVNSAGQGEWGEPASVDIGGNSTAPANVSNVTATQGTFKSKIDVTWERVPGATAYYVFRYDYSSESWEGPKTVTSNSFSDDHASVQSGAWFAYTIVAGNTAGNSDYSEPVLGRTNPNATRAGMVLSAPEDVQARIKGDTITVQWKKVKGAAEYYVFRKKEKADDYEFVSGVPAAKNSFSEKIPGQPGDLFYYVVRTKSSLGGESENSAAVAGFVNKQREAITHRFLPGKGIDRFTGKWTAMAWSGGAPTQYEAEISADGGDFTIALKSGGKAKSYKGSYVSESDIMETKDIRLELTDVEGTLVATIYGKSDTTVTFTRQ